MRYLRFISVVMTIVGIASIALSLAFDLPSMWTLAGMLLVIAGGVKIAMVVLWNGVAAVNTPPISRDDA
ncbi:MAG: hypothetical protein ACRDJH_03710 [Thermomicrobiales bacterium]